MIQRILLNLPGLAAVLLIACAEDTPVSEPATATLQEELRLDANAEDFSRIELVAVGPHGEILVPLSYDGVLRIYDSTGKRVASFGRKGDAPGEFRMIGAVGFKADTIWLQDAMSRKHTYVTLRGELLRVQDLQQTLARITPDYTKEYLYIIPVGELHDGTMLAGAATRPSVQQPIRRLEFLNVTGAGVLRKVGHLDTENNSPLATAPLFGVTADAQRWATIAVNSEGRGGSYTLSVFRHNGEPLLQRSYPFTGDVIPQHVKDSIIKRRRSQVMQGSELGGTAESKSSARVAVTMPDVYPPVQSVVPGMDSTTWIGLREKNGVRQQIVVDEKGDELGRVNLSSRQRLYQATATRIWVAERDSLDLVSVVRYRVVGLKGR